MRRDLFLVLLLVVGLLVFAVSLGPGCRQGPRGKEVKLAYVHWDDEIAATYVVKNVLEEMGYDVQVFSVGDQVLWECLANGEYDATVSVWLPETQGHYYAEFANQVEVLGPNLEGVKIGLVVPDYVRVSSLEELNEFNTRFDIDNDGRGEIIGVERDHPVMKATAKAVQEYHLDFDLEYFSPEVMATLLEEAVREGRWVVATGWVPHWMFLRWDLRFLEDPRQVYGEQQYMTTIVRRGLKKEVPEVYRFLDRFSWEPADIEKVMLDIRVFGMNPDDAAKKWIEENRQKVHRWLAR